MQQIIADVFLCWMLVLAANAVLNVISDVRADNRDRREREESGVFWDAPQAYIPVAKPRVGLSIGIGFIAFAALILAVIAF